MDKQKKNILMLITEMSMGGAEKVFYDHSRVLKDKNNVIECVYSEKGYEPSFRTGNCLEILDDEVFDITSIQRFINRKRRLEHLFSKHQIDVCISHMEGPNILSCFARKGRTKRILCVHGTLMADTNKKGWRRVLINKLLVPFAYNKADYVVPVSRAIANELEILGVKKEKIFPIENYFDLDVLVNRAKEQIESEMAIVFEKYPVLINVGRLSAQKNQVSLIYIFVNFLKKQNNAKLILIGDGPEREMLLNLSRSLNLKTYAAWESIGQTGEEYQVFFLGKKENPLRYVKRAEALILTSTHEGFPLVLGEAMSIGTPIISVDCPTGPREMLSESISSSEKLNDVLIADHGILMPSLQYAEKDQQVLDKWNKAISFMMRENEEKQRMINQAQKRVEQYSKNIIMAKWQGLIDQC